jgi:caffeoyl-CoA O-methyltransferase
LGTKTPKTGMLDKTMDYCVAISSPMCPVLDALERETHLRTLSPQMLSGPYQGKLLQFVSRMIRPKKVLEVGGFTGYASICLADGLDEGGTLHTIEVNDELGWIMRKHFQLAGLEDRVHLYIGDAGAVVPTLDGGFDLVFLDAGKLDYASHYALCLDKMTSGGFMLIDNVLWDGKVAGGDQKDETAVVLRAFNQMVADDPRVENILLPIRDGLMMVQKK